MKFILPNNSQNTNKNKIKIKHKMHIYKPLRALKTFVSKKKYQKMVNNYEKVKKSLIFLVSRRYIKYKSYKVKQFAFNTYYRFLRRNVAFENKNRSIFYYLKFYRFLKRTNPHMERLNIRAIRFFERILLYKINGPYRKTFVLKNIKFKNLISLKLKDYIKRQKAKIIFYKNKLPSLDVVNFYFKRFFFFLIIVNFLL